MKWMVQVLDSLLPYVSDEQQQVEQKNLENLIGRYKHLIPTIDMTITKTEMYTKCIVYKKEVTEVSDLYLYNFFFLYSKFNLFDYINCFIRLEKF